MSGLGLLEYLKNSNSAATVVIIAVGRCKRRRRLLGEWCNQLLKETVECKGSGGPDQHS